MAHVADILTQVHLAVEANATLSAASVVFWDREELDSDELDRAKVNVFCYPIDEQRVDPGSYIDFRRYRFRVVLRFEVDGRSLADSSGDTVTSYKSTYNDALQTAMQTTNANQTYAISNVYIAEFAGTEWNYKEDSGPYNESHARVYRIAQLWDFYTYES
jgi:hypothetical protein